MIIWLSLIFPLAGLVWLVVRHGFTAGALPGGVLLLVSALLVLAAGSLSESAQTRATEYWGGYATSATYTEPWNEYIHQICWDEHCSGTGKNRSCYSTPRDCSYCREHDAEWDVSTTLGSYSGHEDWSRAVAAFGMKPKLVPLGRNSQCSFPRNGNAYRVQYPGDSAHLLPVFDSRIYENRPQAAPTLFSFPAVDTSRYPVFEYPNGSDAGFEHSTLLTRIRFPRQSRTSDILAWYNGRFGAARQVHAWLLVFNGGTVETGMAQQAFWKGGGKNELITTVGIDRTGTILWCYVFSWSPSKTSEIQLRDAIVGMKSFDGPAVADSIGRIGVKSFVRKHFREFSYIHVQPSATSAVVTSVIVFLLALGATAGIDSKLREDW